MNNLIHNMLLTSSRSQLVIQIPRYSYRSTDLSLVTFRCLLQDTGYPLEVYLPGDDQPHPTGPSSKTDWSKLRERWIGWGVE